MQSIGAPQVIKEEKDGPGFFTSRSLWLLVVGKNEELVLSRQSQKSWREGASFESYFAGEID